MIYDILDNFKNYICLNKRFNIVNDFLNNNYLRDIPFGTKTIGDGVYYIKQKYIASKENKTYEVHKDYIDIQIIIGNLEKMKYSCDKKEINIINNNDCYNFEAKTDIECKFNRGFFIFFPGELHNPGGKINDKEIVKIVFKVKAN